MIFCILPLRKVFDQLQRVGTLNTSIDSAWKRLHMAKSSRMAPFSRIRIGFQPLLALGCSRLSMMSRVHFVPLWQKQLNIPGYVDIAPFANSWKIQTTVSGSIKKKQSIRIPGFKLPTPLSRRHSYQPPLKVTNSRNRCKYCCRSRNIQFENFTPVEFASQTVVSGTTKIACPKGGTCNHFCVREVQPPLAQRLAFLNSLKLKPPMVSTSHVKLFYMSRQSYTMISYKTRSTLRHVDFLSQHKR
eukprot:284815652_4